MKNLLQSIIIRWRIPVLFGWAVRGRSLERLKSYTGGGR